MGSALFVGWDRRNQREKQAHERLRKATVSLKIAKGTWGTAFFVAGSAGPEFLLTADHNVRDHRNNLLTAYFDDGEELHEIKLDWMKKWSSQQADIAVLRVVKIPSNLPIESLSVNYLGQLISEKDRAIFWGGCPVAIYGYPLRDNNRIAESIDGGVDASLPLTRTIPNGRIRSIQPQQRFNVRPRQQLDSLSGISGAAIFSLDHQCVIGVQVGVGPDGWQVFGAEIGELVHAVADPELSALFTPWFDNPETVERGIAAAVRAANDPHDPELKIVSVQARLSPGTLSGDMVGGTDAHRQQSQAAVRWLAGYLQRLPGAVSDLMKIRGCAVYSMARADPGSPQTLNAALVLAALSRLIFDFLNYDLDVAVEFPESLILCAAGFGEHAEEVAGDLGIASPLANYPFRGPATILHSRGQEAEFRQPFPKEVRLLPCDEAAHMAQEVWRQFLRLTESERVVDALERRLRAALEECCALEQSVQEIKRSAMGAAARQRDLTADLFVMERVNQYLETKIEQAGTSRPQDERPLAGLIAEEVDRLVTEWRRDVREKLEEQNEPRVVIHVWTPEHAGDEARRKRLFRRLALLCAGDLPGSPPKNQKWFTTLIERKRDLSFLRTLEAALDPLSGTAGSANFEADAASRRFDRLVEVRSLEKDLRGRIRERRAEIQSFGDPARIARDAESIKLRDAIRMMQQRIEAQWRVLRWKLKVPLDA